MLYRAGRFQEAAQRFAEAETAPTQSSNAKSTIVYNWLFQAMAQHQLDNAGEATSWLKKAGEAMHQSTPGSHVAGSDPWNRRLT